MAKCEYKIDTHSDGNVMPIKIFKVLFQNTTAVDLNTCMDKNVVAHVYKTVDPA